MLGAGASRNVASGSRAARSGDGAGRAGDENRWEDLEPDRDQRGAGVQTRSSSSLVSGNTCSVDNAPAPAAEDLHQPIPERAGQPGRLRSGTRTINPRLAAGTVTFSFFFFFSPTRSTAAVPKFPTRAIVLPSWSEGSLLREPASGLWLGSADGRTDEDREAQSEASGGSPEIPGFSKSVFLAGEPSRC